MDEQAKTQTALVLKQAIQLFEAAHIILTPAEKEGIEIASFGLGDIYHTGLQLVTYVNTERCCAKEMVLLPGQTCPEHRHAPITKIGYLGKEETFRCRFGTVYLYVDGDSVQHPHCVAPAGDEAYYTVWHEICLRPGEQYTMFPNTKHWFQAGQEGAVISEFSTKSYDKYDIFTDPHIVQVPDKED